MSVQPERNHAMSFFRPDLVVFVARKNLRPSPLLSLTLLGYYGLTKLMTNRAGVMRQLGRLMGKEEEEEGLIIAHRDLPAPLQADLHQTWPGVTGPDPPCVLCHGERGAKDMMEG